MFLAMHNIAKQRQRQIQAQSIDIRANALTCHHCV
jgi:hypothetical protein